MCSVNVQGVHWLVTSMFKSCSILGKGWCVSACDYVLDCWAGQGWVYACWLSPDYSNWFATGLWRRYPDSRCFSHKVLETGAGVVPKLVLVSGFLSRWCRGYLLDWALLGVCFLYRLLFAALSGWWTLGVDFWQWWWGVLCAPCTHIVQGLDGVLSSFLGAVVIWYRGKCARTLRLLGFLAPTFRVQESRGVSLLR